MAPIELVDTNTPAEILASHSAADLTVREHMAMESLKAISLCPFFDATPAAMANALGVKVAAIDMTRDFPRYLAKLAVQQADALITELANAKTN